MRAQPVEHLVAQRLRLQHHRVGTVARDLAGQPVGHPDVDADLLAAAAVQRPRTDDVGPAPQRGGAPVGDPHPGLRSGRRLADHLVHDLAQVNPVGRLDRTCGADGRHVGADARQPESAGGLPVAVMADEVPAPPIGDHTPRLDGADRVRLVSPTIRN